METPKTHENKKRKEITPDWVKNPPKDFGGAKVGPEEKVETDRQRANKMNTAINTCLEFDMAFKLMSYRVANQDMFLNRVHDLALFLVNEFKVIDEQSGKEPS